MVGAKTPRLPAIRTDWQPGWQSCTMAGVPCCWHASAYLRQVSTRVAFCSLPVYSLVIDGSKGVPRWLISTWTFPVASLLITARHFILLRPFLTRKNRSPSSLTPLVIRLDHIRRGIVIRIGHHFGHSSLSLQLASILSRKLE